MENKINMFSGFKELVDSQAAKKKEWLEYLKQLPSENPTIPNAELADIKKLDEILDACLKQVDEKRIAHEKNPQQFPAVDNGGAEEQKTLANILNVFDKLDIWSYKFSTESQGTGKNLTETPNDSIYYMTNSGASVRFKMANRNKGLRKVVQPFAEFIFFDDPEKGLSEIPKLGYNTEEYFSKDFGNLLSANELPIEDYKSSIKKYYQNGKFIAAPKSDKITFHHNGSPVNKIFFENKK